MAQLTGHHLFYYGTSFIQVGEGESIPIPLWSEKLRTGSDVPVATFLQSRWYVGFFDYSHRFRWRPCNRPQQWLKREWRKLKSLPTIGVE